VSWLVMWWTIGVVAGIGLAAYVRALPLLVVQQYVIAWSLLFIALKNRRIAMVAVVLISGVLIGLARGSMLQSELREYAAFYKEAVVVRGVVSEDVALTSGGEQRLQLQHVVINNQQLPGKVWVSTHSQLDIKRGDIVQFQGMLNEGFGNLPAAMYRAKLVHIERPKYSDMGRQVRDWFAGVIRKVIPEPEASLGIGYLVGQRSVLPEKLDDQLRVLGLTHVVVASGYNLTILVRFTRRSFMRFSKYLAFLTALLMVGGFALMTGFSPSMSRAALVTVLSLVAWYFGRTIQPLVLLAVVSAVTAYINPTFVWGDIGWYLSMFSFAGIMILAPLARHYFFGKDATPSLIPSIVLETMSAQLATLPLIAYIFGQYSPYALLANVLVLPLIPFAMLATFIAGVVAAFSPALGEIVQWPATIVLQYMITVVDIVSGLPGAAYEFTVGLEFLIGGYVVLVAICLILWRKTKHNFGKDNLVL